MIDKELVAGVPAPSAGPVVAVATTAEPAFPPFLAVLPPIGPSVATGAMLGAALALVRVRQRWAARNAPGDRVRALDIGIALTGTAGMAALGLTAIAANAPEIPNATYVRSAAIESQGRYVVRLHDPETNAPTYAIPMPPGVRPVSVKLSTGDRPDRSACVQVAVVANRLGSMPGSGSAVTVEAEDVFFSERNSWVPAAPGGLGPCPPATGAARSVVIPAYPER